MKTGETLGEISQNYNVPKAYIIKENDLGGDTVVEGQKLTIPARGVPFDDPVPPDDGIEFQPFPGTKWFQTEPNSPIVTAMGERLVTEECNRYSDGPGPQWTEADRESYQEWQRKLGYSGDAADGWPGATSWEQLRVPYVGQVPDSYEPFPGAEWFHTAPDSPVITAMGKRLVAEGCDEYEVGPGPQWTEADKRSYAKWQKKLGYSGDAADGWPGATSWEQLQVPKQ